MTDPLHRLLTDVVGDQSQANTGALPPHDKFEELWRQEREAELGQAAMGGIGNTAWNPCTTNHRRGLTEDAHALTIANIEANARRMRREIEEITDRLIAAQERTMLKLEQCVQAAKTLHGQRWRGGDGERDDDDRGKATVPYVAIRPTTGSLDDCERREDITVANGRNVDDFDGSAEADDGGDSNDGNSVDQEDMMVTTVQSELEGESWLMLGDQRITDAVGDQDGDGEHDDGGIRKGGKDKDNEGIVKRGPWIIGEEMVLDLGDRGAVLRLPLDTLEDKKDGELLENYTWRPPWRRVETE